MVIKEIRVSRHPPRVAAVISMALMILFMQSALLITPQQRLFAAKGEGYSDQLMAIGNEPKQASNCDVSSYQVQPGDTIGDVAGRAGTTSQRVVDCNGITTGVVYAGQVLNLPNEVNPNRGTAPQTRYPRTYRPTPPTQNRYQGANNGSSYNGQRGRRRR